jgi:hypothetical protein
LLKQLRLGLVSQLVGSDFGYEKRIQTKN